MDPVARFSEALDRGIEATGLDVEPAARTKMAQHYGLLSKWAKKFNLTSLHDPEEAAELHALDCLLFAEQIDPQEEGPAVDVGSGAGFPGIIVALVRPKLALTLLEPIRKRATFLRVACTELALDHVRIQEGRLEVSGSDLGEPNLIMSRATIPPLDLVARAADALPPGGRMILSAGAGAPPVEALKAAGDVEHLKRVEYTLPGGHQRVLDTLRVVTPR